MMEIGRCDDLAADCAARSGCILSRECSAGSISRRMVKATLGEKRTAVGKRNTGRSWNVISFRIRYFPLFAHSRTRALEYDDSTYKQPPVRIRIDEGARSRHRQSGSKGRWFGSAGRAEAQLAPPVLGGASAEKSTNRNARRKKVVVICVRGPDGVSCHAGTSC